MNAQREPIERQQFETERLMDEHPPVWRHPKKQIVFAIACPPDAQHAGRLDYSPWPAIPLPPEINAGAPARRVVGRSGFYDYAPFDLPGAMEWHVNFADPHLCEEGR
jgi:hypothetical protein